MRKRIVLLVILAGLADPDPISAADDARPTYPQAIPFERTGSTILVPVRVNQSEPRWFILDTGANSCVLSADLAGELQLVPHASGDGTGAGKGTVPYLRYPRDGVLFEVGRVQLRSDYAISMDLSHQPGILGRRIDGILGSDFFAPHVVVIDYDAQVLQLLDPVRFTYRGGGEVLPLVFERRLPYVTARITVAGVPPADRRLLLDTGSEDAVDDDLILRSTGPGREVTGGVGIGQTYTVTFGWVDRLQLGRFELTRLPSVAPGVALLGGEVLRRFRVILDYSRSQLILEPGAHFDDQYREDRSGLDLRLVEEASTLRVESVEAQSVAARAGMSPGDRIVAVDGTAIAELGLRRVQTMLTVPGGRFRLRVQTATTQRDVDLELR